MRNNRLLTITLVGGLVVLAAGCVKEQDMNETYRPEGTPIIFTAATGYENGNGTRTEYSGSFFDANGNPNQNLTGTANNYERIDWVANDPVKVFYAHGSGTPAQAVYAVSGTPSADDEISNASISVTSGSKLTWTAGGANHVFTAMYPTNGFNANSTLGNTYANNSITFNDGTHVTAQIPAAQKAIPTQTTGKYRPNMAYAYMIAYKEIASSSNDREVYLPFTPAMTAFEFRFKLPSNFPSTPSASNSARSFKVKSFRMHTSTSNKFLAGNFSFEISALKSSDGKDRGGTWQASSYSVSGGSQDITVTFDSPVVLSTSTDLDFTIFALPQNHTDITLYLTYVDNSNNEYTKHVDLKSGTPATFYQFDACKKYIITNYMAGYDEWDYFIDVSNDVVTYGHDAASGGFNIVSYKQSKADPTVRFAVPWKIQYTTVSNPSESDWNNLTSSGVQNSALNATFNVTNLTGQGALPSPATPNANTASVSGQTPADSSGEEGSSDPGSAARAKLASASPRGSSSAPFDLSRHPFYGNNIDGTPGNINSANCYIVSAPGYYMFPCVYGNSIKNSKTNISSYWPSTAEDVVSGDGLTKLKEVNSTFNTDGYPAHYYLPRFYNAWNEVIRYPYIWEDCTTDPDDMTAIVVWQDTAEHDEIIPYAQNQITNPAELGIRTETVTIDNASKSCQYVWFKIDSENIKPGNIMIALRDGSDIIWSWHIWVTEKDLEPQSTDSYQLTLNDNTTETFTVMPFNLGWLDSASGSVTKYKDRAMQYRAVQDDGVSTLSDPFSFTQYGDAKTITPTVGGNPYYQWGRKDPLIPSMAAGTDRPFSQNPSLPNISPRNGVCIVHSSNLEYGDGIKYPYILYSNDQTLGWIGGQAHPFHKTTYMMKRVNSRMSGPYTWNQVLAFVNTGLLPSGLSWWSTDSNGFWWLATSAPLHLGPYTATQRQDILDIDNIDPTGDHFQPGDFSNGYTAAERMADGSCPYNLWNNFIYTDQPANDSWPGSFTHTTRETKAAVFHRNKFKTIYDPCPAGFAVPTKASYIGNSYVEYAMVGAEHWKGAAPFPGLTMAPSTGDLAGVGMMVNGSILFPYTGARVCYNGSGTVVLTPENQTSHGYYWTDNPLRMEVYAAGSTTNMNVFYFYQHAYMFLFSAGANGVQYFTRGSAGSIRPMLETNANDI